MKEMHLVVVFNHWNRSIREDYWFLSLVVLNEFINKLNRLVDDGTIESWSIESSEVKDNEFLAQL